MSNVTPLFPEERPEQELTDRPVLDLERPQAELPCVRRRP